MNSISRRHLLAASSVLAASAAIPNPARALDATPANFIFCLNTATIMGQKLKFPQQIELAAKVGYQALEPWTRDIHAHVKAGGSLADAKKRLADLNLTIEDAIGFANWIVNDDAKRAAGLEEAKRDMDVVAQLGGKRIAAPAAGASGANDPVIDLHIIAERYAALCDLGQKMGIQPMVEVWGPSKNLTHLSDAVFVALESHHPLACVLPDIYHLYKGNSDITNLHLLSHAAVPMIHFNDYPATIDRAKITDADRVMPGDGAAPIKKILNEFKAMGGTTVLSLEIFNRQYWAIDAELCARQGLEKMKAAVAASA
jgi:2-keto-myo-inositol isomerase